MAIVRARNPAPMPDVTVTPAEHNPGELLLDVTAARILTTVDSKEHWSARGQRQTASTA